MVRIYIIDYSTKAIVLRGDTDQISDILKALHGIFSNTLKRGGPGWIFPKKHKKGIYNTLQTMDIDIIEQSKDEIRKNLTIDYLREYCRLMEIDPTPMDLPKIADYTIDYLADFFEPVNDLLNNDFFDTKKSR